MLFLPPLMEETRHHGWITSALKREGSPCQQHDDGSQGGQVIPSIDDLPEDIFRHIHALMPLRDAARAACASQIFRKSWRCYPNLTLSRESLGLSRIVFGEGKMIRDLSQTKMTRDLFSKVDHILKKHSGVGMKKLELKLVWCNKIDYCYLSNWLRIAVTAGIEELTMLLPRKSEVAYNFPCSLLFGGSENSIKNLQLAGCAFRPTAGLDCRRRLTKLWLIRVLITGDELENLLCNSFTLEWLGLSSCNEIVCVKIPCQLQRLSFLEVSQCRNLQEIESNAPNVSTFHFFGEFVKISFGGSLQLQVKDIQIRSSCQSNIFWYVRTKLMPSVPNVETLHISSCNETISTPTLRGKFLHLKYLHISLNGGVAISPAYDYLSLVSFLVASPCLETFIFDVRQRDMKHDSIIGDSSQLRQLLPEHRYDNLKSVAISGFCSAKSLVELACHIIENASSLESLTLDTTKGCDSSYGCSVDNTGVCVPMGRNIIKEAHRALVAIRAHIEGIIPSRVKFTVIGPCSRCHAVDNQMPS
uniref:Uncharacterized protein n=1 Tax=Avena sativa TaxID=4498 RepID=A0ACD5YGC1_AVESA